MIVIAIIGILAAIALPAYAKYMARARFTEVTSAIDGVKKQVELCIFDLGQTKFSASQKITPATVDGKTCQNGDNGNGWKIGESTDYATKYVATIVVEAGVITATAISGNGLNSATYQSNHLMVLLITVLSIGREMTLTLTASLKNFANIY